MDKKSNPRIQLLNVEIDNITCDELLQRLHKGVLVTPNMDILLKHQTIREFHEADSKAEFSVCDSRIVYLCARLLGLRLKEVIPGSSFFPRYCDYHAANPAVKVFLLGAREGVAATARDKINARVGREMVVGAYSPPFGFEKDEAECSRIVRMINSSGANVVLVGLGNPKQSLFIQRFKNRMPGVDVWMALGATIDFEAGNIKRAPRICQKLCLEWFYRFCKEPKRLFRRYFIDDIKVFRLFLLQKLGRYRDPFAS